MKLLNVITKWAMYLFLFWMIDGGRKSERVDKDTFDRLVKDLLEPHFAGVAV